jgi:hypothetical protein
VQPSSISSARAPGRASESAPERWIFPRLVHETPSGLRQTFLLILKEIGMPLLSIFIWFVGIVTTTAGSFKIFKKFKRVYKFSLPDAWRLDFRKLPEPLPLHFVDREIYKYIRKRLERGLAGVYVHWSIAHAGKSVCALAVAHEIWQQNRYA